MHQQRQGPEGGGGGKGGGPGLRAWLSGPSAGVYMPPGALRPMVRIRVAPGKATEPKAWRRSDVGLGTWPFIPPNSALTPSSSASIEVDIFDCSGRAMMVVDRPQQMRVARRPGCSSCCQQSTRTTTIILFRVVTHHQKPTTTTTTHQGTFNPLSGALPQVTPGTDATTSFCATTS